MTTITIAELLTDLSSLKACVPLSSSLSSSALPSANTLVQPPADALALVSVTQDGNKMKLDEEPELVEAKEMIALYKEIGMRKGLEGLEATRRDVEGVVGRSQGG